MDTGMGQEELKLNIVENKKKTTKSLSKENIAYLITLIAILLLVVISWKSADSEVKLAILTVIGLSFYITGFILLKKYKNTIAYVTAYTGAGVTLITIVFGSMAFNIINETMTLIMILLWLAAWECLDC